MLDRKRTAAAAAALAVLAALAAGCSGGASSAGAGSLTAALGRVADTPATRSAVYYDDTSALVRVTGRSWRAAGFGLLLGTGAPGLADAAPELSAGIDLLQAQYEISAGGPASAVGLVAGGQAAARATRFLTGLGWQRSGGGLTAPPLTTAITTGTLSAELAVPLARAAASGGDLTYAGPSGQLGEVGRPAGKTLAGDPVTSALARCLGPVAAAYIGTYPGAPASVRVAVGVRAPAARASMPRAVGCVSFGSAAAAAPYLAQLRRDLLGRALDTATELPFSQELTHGSVRAVDGAQHVVQWQAQSPGNADLVLEMADRSDLPGLA